MHSFIIASGNPKIIFQTIIDKLGLNISQSQFINSPDLIKLESLTSIGIKEVKLFSQKLYHQPLQLKYQIGLVLNSSLLTIPAQNACLKLLEEPGKKTVIFLAEKNPYKLLPTIASRCQIIWPAKKGQTDTLLINSQNNPKEFLDKIMQASLSEKLALVENHSKDRQQAIEFCQNLLEYINQQSLQSKKYLKFLLPTASLLQELQQNLNLKLAWDNWAICLQIEKKQLT